MSALPRSVDMTVGEPPEKATMTVTNAGSNGMFPDDISVTVVVPGNPSANQSIVVQRNTLTTAAVDELLMPDLELDILNGTCGLPIEDYRRLLVAILVRLRTRPRN